MNFPTHCNFLGWRGIKFPLEIHGCTQASHILSHALSFRHPHICIYFITYRMHIYAIYPGSRLYFERIPVRGDDADDYKSNLFTHSQLLSQYILDVYGIVSFARRWEIRANVWERITNKFFFTNDLERRKIDIWRNVHQTFGEAIDLRQPEILSRKYIVREAVLFYLLRERSHL